MSYLGASLLIKTLPSIINGTNNRIKQDEREVTYGYIITKEEEITCSIFSHSTFFIGDVFHTLVIRIPIHRWFR